MSMEGRLLARARQRKAEQLAKNQEIVNLRRDEIYKKIPEIKVLDEASRSLMTELIGIALGKGNRSVPELEEQSRLLSERRAELLRRNGYSDTYLDPIYTCPVCQDKGNIGGKNCGCLIALYKQEQTRDLAPLLQNEPGGFKAFRLDYYSDVPTASGESPRSIMKDIYDLCHYYAENFSPASGNLLLTGNPGLGKTFLSAAMARVIADKGFSVAYDTVTGLLSAFEKEKFTRDDSSSKEASEKVRQIMDCDLLILDDLGTEMSSSFTQSALYSLIDGRIRAKKQMIISTNLGKDDLPFHYGPQLTSRLNGEFTWLEFVGQDIRSLKKKEELL